MFAAQIGLNNQGRNTTTNRGTVRECVAEKFIPPAASNTRFTREPLDNSQQSLPFDENEIISFAGQANVAPAASPFVKWVGGKRKLLGAILKVAPASFDRFIEPFLGGGAVALALGWPTMLLNDANPELMNAYRTVRDDVCSLMALLDKHRAAHSKEYFYEVRKQLASSVSPLEQAARLIYLNKTCYNGLYRVNKEGQFNAPYGQYTDPILYDEQKLRRASDVLKGAELFTGGYKTFLEENAREGDFIYLDPPYVPIGQYSDFKRYTREQFRADDQKILAELYSKLIRRGCFPVLSNSYSARELYAEHHIIEVTAARNINKDAKGRGHVTEILVTPRQTS